MKTICLLTAIILLLQCLTGCQSASPDETQPTADTTIPVTESDTVPDTTVADIPVIMPENLYSVAVPITTEYGYAEDESTVFSYAYQTMHLIHPDKDVADKIIIDFLKRVESTRSDADQLYAFTKSKDTSASGFTPYCYQVHYNPTRIDQGVLSLHGQISQSGDFAHSNVQCVSANYDMVTGDTLTLGSILYHADVKSDLCDIVISTLEDRTDLNLYDDFRTSVENRFAKDESQDEDFFFTAHGLNFYFSPYEIAPYSSGIITVEIPYHKLTGIIGDAYFPAEQTNTTGTISTCSFEDANLEAYSQFAELIVSSGATKLLLITDSYVQDIQIRALTWMDKLMSQPLSNTVFAANILSPHEAILLDANFSSEKPSFIVSYCINGDIHEFYLIQDSATGQIVLKEIA